MRWYLHETRDRLTRTTAVSAVARLKTRVTELPKVAKFLVG